MNAQRLFNSRMPICMAVLSLACIASTCHAVESKPDKKASNPVEIPLLPTPSYIPSNNKVTCSKDTKGSPLSIKCPVVEYHDIYYWPLSYIDNRESINLVGYNTDGEIVSQKEYKGARYIWKATVHRDQNRGEEITFFGQANNNVVVPVDDLK